MKKFIILSLVSLFTLPSIAQTAGVKKPQMVSESQAVKMRAELMQSKFNLNNEQTKKIAICMSVRNAALKSVREKVGENQAQYNAGAMPIRQKFQNELKAILTPEQYALYTTNRLENRRDTSIDNLVDETELDIRKE